MISFGILSIVLCGMAFMVEVQAVLVNNKSPIRSLPEKVLIGYATHCGEEVRIAVEGGVNVVIWSFVEIVSSSSSTSTKNSKPGEDSYTDTKSMASSSVRWNSLDPEAIRRMIQDLDQRGFSDTVHLVSFGGWNGPHLDSTPSLSAEEWFSIWQDEIQGRVGFHGIDWDFEGNDDLQSPTNTFSIECLNKMGRISQLAKEEGYIIGIAPPQSYLDSESSHFSRSVNLTADDRIWHADFHYFGANVYAYLLAKFEDSIDFVSIQFYESYSRAAMNILGPPPQISSPSLYLQRYVQRLAKNHFRIQVDFEDDPSINLLNQSVKLPLTKLVFGFANGWAIESDNDNTDDGIVVANKNEKVIFFSPDDIQDAYTALATERPDNLTPRGFMFWVIGEEGTHGISLAPALGKILKTRPSLPRPSLRLEKEL